ncbi:restriction endonuclease subunit S [Aerococcus sp. JJEM-2022a]|uniref:Restriction endonuclease subunit S n=1 Tax=Aerococcus loyolae TaxID=2976809 RepID=A0ABT4BXF0_9LACT|nr:restriction endonuclease subunit S [Aerococcus loyolae]MCY3024931.1 restriction endonuclease subunit S [Aerococcus loyolae]MCY3027013.1 restriction endonuclease subunit S [Aerococcus loyolae]MCY3028597.1 restriction endonuclease subunit S [Aerococcus loyolae]OAM70551.1 hypothetical protein A1D21_02800 [Aerococcus loyolae]
MAEERKQPELRFKGFTDDWIQDKLGDLAEITMGQSPSGSTYSEIPSKYILVQGNADLNNGVVVPRIWTTEVTKMAQKGDIIITVRAPVGEIAKLDYNVVIGRGVAAIKGSHFILHWLNFMRIKGYWKKFSSGSTFDSINSNDLKGAFIIHPEDEKERNRISYFLTTLSKIITLEQQKIEKLELLKQYLLQNMFADKDRNPNLRFNNFEEEWIQDKLGNLSNCFSGGTPNSNNKAYYQGDIPFIRSGEINANSTELYISENAVKESSAKIINKGDLLFALYGATSGEVAISKIGGAINQAILVIFPNNDIDRNFLKYYLELNKNKILSTYLQGGQGNLSGKIVKNILIKFPSKQNQIEIKNLLLKLDNIIILEQSKLEKYQDIKNKLLQSLFI